MHVVLLAAQSLDGKITRHDAPGDGFTSEADKRHFRAEIRRCDACVMGRATYAVSKHQFRPDLLPGLKRVVWTRSPEAHAAEAVPGVLEFDARSPAALHAALHAEGRRRCALLGGGQVNAAWLSAGLVDELCLTIEPRLFGSGISLLDASPETRPRAPRLDLTLSMLECRPLAAGGPLLLRYTVLK